MDDGTAVYDKTAKDLQSNIVIGENEITGTLKHVTGYSAFDASEQDGNFLALSMTADEDVEIKTELVNGVHGEVTVDDGFCVYRITDKSQQSVKITFTKGKDIVTKIYSLTGLDCKDS